MKIQNLFTLGLISVLLSACGGSSLMTRPDNAQITQEQDKAVIVFMRPSSLGYAISSSVWHVDEQQKTDFVGLVPSEGKFAYAVNPGQHMFMVIAENADFMYANVEAGKTYYALVSPRMGVWKARFSLLPVHTDANAKYSTQSEEFNNWQNSTTLYLNSQASLDWAKEAKADVQNKKVEYLEKWHNQPKSHHKTLTLNETDGLTH